MALSQKHSGKMLVPWFISNEWKHVNNLIFATNSTDREKQQALNILQMWKLRTPKLPSGVEGTLIILDALLQKSNSVSEHQLRILYGASIMRFLNLCGAIADKQGTFYKTAKANKLPDWLVDLRHDIAHDQIIPSMYMLQMGLDYCINWLKEQYWEQQNATIKDFIIDEESNHIKNLIDLYSRTNLGYYLGDVRSAEDILKSEMVPNQNELCVLIINTSVSNGTDTKGVLKILLENINNEDCCNPEDIISGIISDGYIFQTEVNQCENGTEELPTNFVMIWQDLFKILYAKNMFLPLFTKLIHVSYNVEFVESTRKIASLWLSELSKSLLLSKLIDNQYKALPHSDKLNKETAIMVLKEVLKNDNPDLRECIELDLQQCENIISDLNPLRINIVQNPHKFTLFFMKYFLRLTGCSNGYINNVEAIITAYLYPQSDSYETSSDLHTLDDFECTFNNNIDTTLMNTEAVAVNVNPELNNDVTETEAVRQDEPQRRWRIVLDTSILAGCPLGVLGNQDRLSNPLYQLEPL